MNTLRGAWGNLGWALAMLMTGIALTLAWLVVNPIEVAHDEVVVPIAQTLGVVGAEDCDTARAGDTRVPYCIESGYIVWYDSEGNPTHKMLEGGGPFIYPEDPEW